MTDLLLSYGFLIAVVIASFSLLAVIKAKRSEEKAKKIPIRIRSK